MTTPNDKLNRIAFRYGYIFGSGLIDKDAPFAEMLQLTDSNGDNLIVFLEQKDPEIIFLLRHIEELQSKVEKYERVFSQPSA